MTAPNHDRDFAEMWVALNNDQIRADEAEEAGRRLIYAATLAMTLVLAVSLIAAVSWWIGATFEASAGLDQIADAARAVA